MSSRRWTTLVCCALLSACTPEAPDSRPAPTAPATGGSIEIGMVGEPETLDPYGETASELSYALARPVFPMPFRLLDDGTVERDLAATLETTPKGVRLVLADREWSNGRPIRPADVVASIRRASPPSGFAAVRKARITGPRSVSLTGDVEDWETTLATGAYVLPRGRLIGGNLSGGPFRFASYQRGRRLVYEANAQAAHPPLLERLEVSFVQGTELLLTLLERGEVDAAWLPSTVNLTERLDERDLSYSTKLGDERLVLTYDPARMSFDAVRAFVGEIDLDVLDEAFLDGEGRLGNRDRPAPGGAPALVSLAVPEGDELLTLMQRAIQLDLARSDVTVELITGPVSVLYGRWQHGAPAGLLLHRTVSPPGPRSVVLASVPTYVAWREEVHGIAVNPSLEGPLWNARDWWIEPSI